MTFSFSSTSCLLKLRNDTTRQRHISSIDVCHVHDQTTTSFHSHFALAVTSSVLSTFFHLYCVSSLVSAISEVVFTVFSRNLSKSMQDKNTMLCAATVGDIIFSKAAIVLWYFEALLIGNILPQLERRFKHFLLVIRIIHTSRSFLQKQHQQFFCFLFFLASDTRQLQLIPN